MYVSVFRYSVHASVGQVGGAFPGTFALPSSLSADGVCFQSSLSLSFHSPAAMFTSEQNPFSPWQTVLYLACFRLPLRSPPVFGCRPAVGGLLGAVLLCTLAAIETVSGALTLSRHGQTIPVQRRPLINPPQRIKIRGTSSKASLRIRPSNPPPYCVHFIRPAASILIAGVSFGDSFHIISVHTPSPT